MSTSASKPAPHLFKSPLLQWRFVFPNGTSAVFNKGIYITSNQKEIDHLNLEIELGHPAIYVDPEEVIVSLERIDPMAALRGRMRLELLAELQEEMTKATNPGNDMGKTGAEKFRPASTSDIAAVTANGDAAARLATLRASVNKVAAATTVVEQTGPKPVVLPEIPADETKE